MLGVIESVREIFDGAIVVVDDGSTDATRHLLARRNDVHVVTHACNLGYGRSLIDGFSAARSLGAQSVVTMDCDGQHEPKHIPEFLAALDEGVIVSGSRYLPGSPGLGLAPIERQEVNRRITAMINRVTGWSLTDSFCGFKAYRSDMLAKLALEEPGYAMPMELWAKAYVAGSSVKELPVERIYFDGDRSFGEDLDDAERRLAYYVRVWERALRR